MKVCIFGFLFLGYFTNAALSEETLKADFHEYGYRNDGNQNNDYENSPKNMTERLEGLRTNAHGIEIFLTVMKKVVANGGDTFKIPVEIDPEEHNMSIYDAFDRMDEFLSGQTKEASDLLSDAYQSMQNLQYYSDSSYLEQTRDEIMGILKSLSDAKQDVVDYRRVNSMGQMYDYYYDDTAPEYENQTDDGDKDDEASVPTFEATEVIDDDINQDSDENDKENMDHANEEHLVLNVENEFNKEYDKDDLKNVTNEFEATTESDSVKQFEAILVEEEEDLEKIYENDLYEANKPIYGSGSIDITDVVPDEELYDTKVDWEDSAQEYEPDAEESNNMFLVGRLPIRVYIAIAVPLGLFLISIIVTAVCWYGSGHRQSVTIRARSLTDSDRESKVSVVSICDSDRRPIHPSVWAKLPSYLEVISEKVEPVQIGDLKIPL